MSSPPPVPRVSRQVSLPLIWVVPLVALLVAGWMIARQLGNRGPGITIDFPSGGGVEPGRTPVIYKGVTVGVVKRVSLKSDLSGVHVQVRLNKAGAPVARSGSLFWIVQPEVSLSGVRGLETILNGPRIQVRPGRGEIATHFKGLERPPPLEDPQAGTAFVLRAEKLGGLRPGSPVYYREVRIGSVETTRLTDDSTEVAIRVRIHTPYVNLVRTNSQFWNASGVSLKFGLTGAEVKAGTLQSILAGGVVLGTPDVDPLAPPALEGTEFRLKADPGDEWLTWKPRIPIEPVDSTPASANAEPTLEVGTARIDPETGP